MMSLFFFFLGRHVLSTHIKFYFASMYIIVVIVFVILYQRWRGICCDAAIEGKSLIQVFGCHRSLQRTSALAAEERISADLHRQASLGSQSCVAACHWPLPRTRVESQQATLFCPEEWRAVQQEQPCGSKVVPCLSLIPREKVGHVDLEH